MTLLAQTPNFDVAVAEGIARNLFRLDLTAPIRQLDSERDQNFLLETRQEKFVLKVSNSSEQFDDLVAQNEMMRQLSMRGPMPVQTCVRVIPSAEGNAIETVESPVGARHFVRLVSFVEGRPMSGLAHVSDDLLEHLGETIGRVSNALVGFDHPAFHRDFHWDLANCLSVVEARLKLVADDSRRSMMETLMSRFRLHTLAWTKELPQSVIHNDANDGNLIVVKREGRVVPDRVVGIIDFGDAVWSWTVAELAVAIAYAILDSDDPLNAIRIVLNGYLGQRSLTEAEAEALYGLVCMRLCVSVAMAAEQQAQRPDDPYLSVSQAPIARTLPQLVEIPYLLAAAMIREHCGYHPFPKSLRVCEWLSANGEQFAFPVSAIRRDRNDLCVLDLGVESPLLVGNPKSFPDQLCPSGLVDAKRNTSAKASVGRYLEPRLIYSSSLFGSDDSLHERRTIHLGVDIFVEPGTKVKAPLAGVVHAFHDNSSQQDYGPVVILKHETNAGDTFYTLYGHLTRRSLEDLAVGQTIAAGQEFTAIGEAHENGGWPPHLHLQIIVDMLDLGTDFPGVCRASRVDEWRVFSPDPDLLLRLPEELSSLPSMPKPQALSKRNRRLGRNLSMGYRRPVKIVRGWMQHLYDENGRRYLDAYNNVPHVGHCHPRIVKVLHEQARLLNTNTRYLSDIVLEYADKLTKTMPDGLDVCFFLNSASEANELALRLARAKTKGKDVIVLEGAYHGHSTNLIDISPYKHNGPGGLGAPDWVHTAPVADTYRGAHRDTSTAGSAYAKSIRDIIEGIQESGRQLSSFIAESCPSVGGQILFPPGYLTEVYRYVRAAGGVCIADDVQTGYGRLGSWFYGFEQQDVVPDIVVLGKPIGNGHPIAAVVTTADIADAFANGMEFFSTFGGNTVSAAVGKAVLEVVQEEDLPRHAKSIGDYLLERFRELQTRYSIIGDVRGSGLFLGIELVRDRTTLEAADREAEYVANRMRELGVLLGTDGPLHNVVKIRPPMPFDRQDADTLVDLLDATLGEIDLA